jgi:TonB family protein
MIKKDRADSKRRAACFFFSFLIHAVLITVLFSLNISVSINLEQLKVREALLVSPEQLIIPRDMEDSLRRLQETSRDEPRGDEDKRAMIQDKAGVRGNPAQTPEAVNQEELYSKERNDDRIPTEEEAFFSDLASNFKLGGSLKSESDLHPDYVLDFSLEFGNTQKILSEVERATLERDAKQLKYPRSGFFNIGFSKGSTGPVRTDFGGAAQKARASFRIEDYDISPWAEKVVKIILTNWVIPYPKEVRAKGVVGISVIINESGEILSAQVVNSSLILLLDEAALKALKESSPFPPLPEDFPRNSLEAYFEFHYDD